jgi:ABC-type multidrug transport system ATPase subunit
LALAINLVPKKSIYIFDEATSNIDIESETIIMKNIAELKRAAAVVLITHRLENAAGADCIYVLKDGQVVESGTHAALNGKNGEYARLYGAQKALERGRATEVATAAANAAVGTVAAANAANTAVITAANAAATTTTTATPAAANGGQKNA